MWGGRSGGRVEWALRLVRQHLYGRITDAGLPAHHLIFGHGRDLVRWDAGTGEVSSVVMPGASFSWHGEATDENRIRSLPGGFASYDDVE